MSVMRLYDPEHVGTDGYPPEWHKLTAEQVTQIRDEGIDLAFGGLKHAVRIAAGNRCVRCLHPYRNGEHGRGEWTPCDGRCTHRGPYRFEWNDIWEEVDGGEEVNTAGQVKHLIGDRAIEARWRILTVHHLDMDKANCRWWNLAALCQRCHLTIQGRVKMERVWPWEHSEWFRPYVAGFYALTYLGEDLDRPAVEDRLDELLGLERVT